MSWGWHPGDQSPPGWFRSRGPSRRFGAPELMAVEAVLVLAAVVVDDLRDRTTWRIRTQEGRRLLTADEQHLVATATKDEWVRARDLRHLERDLTQCWTDLHDHDEHNEDDEP